MSSTSGLSSITGFSVTTSATSTTTIGSSASDNAKLNDAVSSMPSQTNICSIYAKLMTRKGNQEHKQIISHMSCKGAIEFFNQIARSKVDVTISDLAVTIHHPTPQTPQEVAGKILQSFQEEKKK